MRIGFITDEISPNVEEAIAIGASWGIRDFELRMIGGQRVPQMSSADIHRILRLQRQYGLRITALSPGVFKGAIHEHARLEQELRETLPQTCQLARLFHAPTVIVFGFKRSAEDAPHDERKVLEVLRRAASSAKQHGVTLAVENEPDFWCDTGASTARMLAQIDLPNLRANWDPCNAIGTEEIPYPQGYEAIKKWIVNVHVKDAIRGAMVSCVPIGEGKMDWRGQLQALMRDRAVAHVTIETHCLPLLENSRKNLETLRGLLAAAESF